MKSVRTKALNPLRLRNFGSRRVRNKVSVERAEKVNYTLPEKLQRVIESHREMLELVLTLLNSIDATLERDESGEGDTLDPHDPVAAMMVRARGFARPVVMVRMAMQRVYQVHSGLDSVNLERLEAGKK